MIPPLQSFLLLPSHPEVVASGIDGAAHLWALGFLEMGRNREALSWATEICDVTYSKGTKEFLLKFHGGAFMSQATCIV